MTTTDLFNRTRQYLADTGLVPEADRPAIESTLRDLESAAGALGLETAEQLLADAQPLLTQSTGIVNLTHFLRTSDAALLRLHRNALLLVLLSEAAATGASDKDLAINSSGLPRIKGMPKATREPITGDTIAVLRLTAMLTGHRRVVSAFALALMDTGLLPGEIAHVTPGDFDRLRGPSTLQAPGQGKWAHARQLNLPDEWTRTMFNSLLPVHMCLGLSAEALPVAYTGRQLSAASASFNGIVDRAAEAAGIDDLNITPTRIRNWRVAHTAKVAGYREAADLVGRQDMTFIHEQYMALFGAVDMEPEVELEDFI
jgi:hypothetical protein